MILVSWHVIIFPLPLLPANLSVAQPMGRRADSLALAAAQSSPGKACSPPPAAPEAGANCLFCQMSELINVSRNSGV